MAPAKSSENKGFLITEIRFPIRMAAHWPGRRLNLVRACPAAFLLKW
jgi:hypothetical protein